MHLREEMSNAMQRSLSDVLSNKKGVLTGFVGFATFLDDEGNQKYAVLHNEEGTYTEMLGLIAMLELDTREAITRNFRQE